MRAALARKVRFFGSGSDGPGLYAVGPHRELLGRPVSALGATDGDGASAAIDAVSELADVDLHGELPAQLTGRLSGAGPGRHDLALAVNGRVATVSRSFPWQGQERFSAFAPPQTFRPGRNVVEVLLVPPSGPPRRLGDNSAGVRSRPSRSRVAARGTDPGEKTPLGCPSVRAPVAQRRLTRRSSRGVDGVTRAV